jgi:excisionase family DNA binding protein
MREGQLLTYREAAGVLGLKLGTLYALVSRNAIPHVRLSARIVRFDAEKLSAWVADKSFTPEPAEVPHGAH